MDNVQLYTKSSEMLTQARGIQLQISQKELELNLLEINIRYNIGGNSDFSQVMKKQSLLTGINNLHSQLSEFIGSSIEWALHTAFKPNRINDNREFFQIRPEQATAILELFDRKDITTEVSAEIENDLSPEDIVAGEKIKSSRRPPINYREMGLHTGVKLTFVKDSSVQVVISGDKKVSYNGEELSLTAVTKKLLGITHALQPTAYWEYEGKNLRDIYDETYTIED